MPEVDGLIELVQGGATVLLTAAVVALWRRLNSVTDSFTSYLKDSARKGDTAALRAITAPPKGKDAIT